MNKIIATMALLLLSVAPSSMAQDISHIADWEKYKNKLLKAGWNDALESEYESAEDYLEEFQPLFFSKEMVKICHEARRGMAAVYFSPAEYSESMQSYNRQLEKGYFGGKIKIGLMEEIILDSVEYSTQKSIINGMSFSAGYDECNKWRSALQLREFGI